MPEDDNLLKPVGPLRKQDRPEWKAAVEAGLVGQPISIRDGARKYGVHESTVFRWTRYKLVKRLRREGSRVLIDEADLAYCAAIHKQFGGVGRRPFDKEGNLRPKAFAPSIVV